MEASLMNILYLAFRFMPFILITYFVIIFLFDQQWNALLFLGGLILTCLLALIAGTLSVFKESKGLDICHSLSLTKDAVVSKLPLSVVVYSYALSYFGIPILHYRRNQSNLPILIFFPIILFLDILWQYFFGCSHPVNIFGAGVVGMTGGLAYSEVVFQSSYKNLQYDSILTDTDNCNMSDTKGFQCVRRSKTGVDTDADAKKYEADLLMRTYDYLGSLYKSGKDELNTGLQQGSVYGSGVADFMKTSVNDLTVPTGAQSTFSAYPGTKMTGNQYNVIDSVLSSDLCQAKCGTDLSCMAYVYDSKANTCTFHTSVGTAWNRQDSATTYYKGSPAFIAYPGTGTASSLSFLLDVSGTVGSIVECANYCLDTSGCQTFKYGIKTKKCRLYNQKVNSIAPISDPQYELGQLQLTLEPKKNYEMADLQTLTPGAQIIRNSINVRDAHFRDLSGATLPKCIEACKKTNGCKGVLFDKKKSKCYSGDSDFLAAGQTESSSTDIAYLTADIPIGKSFNDLGIQTVTDICGCLMACVSNPACVGFSYGTFDPDNPVCHLKSDMSKGANDNESFESYKLPTTHYNSYVSVAYGSSTAKVRQKPVAMISKCDDDPECLGFMYDGTFSIPITSQTILPTPISQTGTTTYFKQTGDPFAMQKFAIIPSTDIQGGDIRSIHNTTVSDCAHECLQNDSCIGFVMDSTDSSCVLKSNFSGQGNKIIKGADFKTTYLEQPIGYKATLNTKVGTGTNDTTLSNTTPNKCSQTCASISTCKGFTYSHATNGCVLTTDVGNPTADNASILYIRQR
jgi:PAN domain